MAPLPVFAPEPEVAAALKKAKGRKSVNQAHGKHSHPRPTALNLATCTDARFMNDAAPQEGPTAKQAADDFETAREDVVRLLNVSLAGSWVYPTHANTNMMSCSFEQDTVHLNTEAEAATQASLDASALT